MNRDRFITPDWAAPSTVQAGTSCRQGGVSEPPYDSLNPASHVGDAPQAVATNRARLGLPGEPGWLQQVHGTRVAVLEHNGRIGLEADAAYTRTPGVICAVLTADCLPVLLCDRNGREVAAVHAGWRGLSSGVIEAALDQFQAPADQILAWLGPAIGPGVYEIGDEVRRAFVGPDPDSDEAFTPTRPDHWLMDIYALARRRLQQRGVEQINGGEYCTFTDAERFYSYRRDGVTGRMASVIWLAPDDSC
ncbi:peptidoglycan editing factor PgeF [Thiohalophilus sp.]|uniref:peptidoglycan editing factor PgeF n=1 Tax=Thiohalophilus sp. TaxID=3028392 RepID=UPI002ACDE504|nr:peptidoglycan editing factor PgeF [Thiohalophilus sp.]MDZ7662352.1 peptidoglycan editing factor PgeF [Thiohalophilus sp.]